MIMEILLIWVYPPTSFHIYFSQQHLLRPMDFWPCSWFLFCCCLEAALGLFCSSSSLVLELRLLAPSYSLVASLVAALDFLNSSTCFATTLGLLHPSCLAIVLNLLCSSSCLEVTWFVVSLRCLVVVLSF